MFSLNVWGFDLGNDSKDRRGANRGANRRANRGASREQNVFLFLMPFLYRPRFKATKKSISRRKKGLFMDLFILKDKRGNGFEKQTVQD